MSDEFDVRPFLRPDSEDFLYVWDLCAQDMRSRFYAGWVCGLQELRADCYDEIFEAGYEVASSFKEARKNGNE